VKSPIPQPDGFMDDPRSAVYGKEADWEVPGWIEEVDN
jgi:hypothetical protein